MDHSEPDWPPDRRSTCCRPQARWLLGSRNLPGCRHCKPAEGPPSGRTAAAPGWLFRSLKYFKYQKYFNLQWYFNYQKHKECCFYFVILVLWVSSWSSITDFTRLSVVYQSCNITDWLTPTITWCWEETEEEEEGNPEVLHGNKDTWYLHVLTEYVSEDCPVL